MVLPLCVRKIEENLELYLLVMGIVAAAVSGTLTLEEFGRIFSNMNLYLITGVVFVLSLLLMLFEKKVDYFAGTILKLSIRKFVFSLQKCDYCR